ncbi:pilus biogenesis protein and ABC-type transporter [Bdellovibrio bacteriovorus W]|nr:pilus biogenesis protein and ABC-type transporter [Bdellovibrio bacteriovorus W]
MYKVLTLALTTFREQIRERLFLVVIIIAAALLGLSFLLGALSFAEQTKILTDFGFLAVEITSLGVALFSGAYLIAKEIEKQTCLLILARPISRSQFILGKYLGLLFLITLFNFAISLVLWILLGLWKTPEQFGAFISISLSLWLESAVVLSFVLFWSLVVRPVLALGAGVGLFLLGHWLEDLKFFANKSGDEVFIFMADAAVWVTPQFYRSNWKSAYFLEKGIPLENVTWMILHLCAWIVIYVLASNFVFRRKDIV